MQKICETAIIHYEQTDAALIDELASYLDSEAHKVFEFFDVEKPKEKVEINIIPTKKEYDKLFKIKNNWKSTDEVPNSSRGCLTLDGTILYLSINDYKNTTHAFDQKDYHKAVTEYKKTLLHEYVHYVNSLFNKKHNCNFTAKYLFEGIAIYLSGQSKNKETKFDYSLEQLSGNSNNFYDGYYLLTKYLLENYNRSFVLELFQSSRQAREFLENELYKKVMNFHFNTNF